MVKAIRPEIDVRTDGEAADWLRRELGKGKLVGNLSPW